MVIAKDVQRTPGHVQPELDRRCRRERLLRVNGLRRDIAGQKRRPFQGELTGFDARHVEQVLDEAAHAGGGAFDAL